MAHVLLVSVANVFALPAAKNRAGTASGFCRILDCRAGMPPPLTSILPPGFPACPSSDVIGARRKNLGGDRFRRGQGEKAGLSSSLHAR